MPLEQTTEALNEQLLDDEQPVAVDESSVTTEQEAQSPEEVDLVSAGETPDEQAAEEDSEVPTEESDEEAAETPQPKSRTERRIHKLLDQRRELSQQNRRLREQLASGILGNGQQPAQQPAPQIAGQAAPQAAPHQSPSRDEQEWAQRYHMAQSDEERLFAQRQWQEAHDRRLMSAAAQAAEQAIQRRQMADRLAAKYESIHEEFPLFDQSGQFDPKSSLLQRAMQLAQQDGGTIQSHGEMLLYLQEARTQLLREQMAAGTAKVSQLQQKQKRLQAATGVESATRRKAAPPRQGGEAARLKRLEALSAQGDMDATRELMTIHASRRVA